MTTLQTLYDGKFYVILTIVLLINGSKIFFQVDKYNNIDILSYLRYATII